MTDVKILKASSKCFEKCQQKKLKLGIDINNHCDSHIKKFPKWPLDFPHLNCYLEMKYEGLYYYSKKKCPRAECIDEDMALNGSNLQCKVGYKVLYLLLTSACKLLAE